MTLYARSDLMSVWVPPAEGGCGATHSRPVTRGVPSKSWQLDCPPCEGHLRGAGKPQVLKFTPGDAKAGILPKQERVAASDPHWSSTPDSVPLTPDEQSTNATRRERGSQQIQMIQALAALRATGIDVPPEAMWLLESELPSGVLKGTMVCANGHDNTSGVKFCAECGISMAAKAAAGEIANVPEATRAGLEPVRRKLLHVATLRKMCRERGLRDDGTKDILLQRLSEYDSAAAAA